MERGESPDRGMRKRQLQDELELLKAAEAAEQLLAEQREESEDWGWPERKKSGATAAHRPVSHHLRAFLTRLTTNAVGEVYQWSHTPKSVPNLPATAFVRKIGNAVVRTWQGEDKAKGSHFPHVE